MRREKLELDLSRWEERIRSMEGHEVDECVRDRLAHSGNEVLSDERTLSAAVEEGIYVENMITEFRANFENL